MRKNNKADFYLSLMQALQQNNVRATFCQAKANEAKSDIIKMSYLGEATGLLQANINIMEQLRKDGLIN